MQSMSENKQDSGNKKDATARKRKVLALLGVLIALIILIFYWMAQNIVFKTMPQERSDNGGKQEATRAPAQKEDHSSLLGLWQEEKYEKYPSVFEFTENGICSEWTLDATTFKCLKYAPYAVQGNTILREGALWLTWRIEGEVLIVKTFDEGAREKTYVRMKNSTGTAAKVDTQKPKSATVPVPKPFVQQNLPEKSKADYVPLSPTPPLPPYRPPKPNILGPWKTYRSFDFGFEVDHPQEFMAEDFSPYDISGRNLSKKFALVIQWTPGLLTYGNVSVDVYRGLTEEEVIRDNDRIIDQHENPIPMVYEGETTIGREGYPAKKFVAAGIPSFSKPDILVGKNIAEYYLVPRNGDYYVFFLTTLNNSKVIEMNRKILSTLRFIDVQPQTRPKVEITSPKDGDRWHMSGNRTYTIRWDTTPVEWYDGYGIVHSRGGKAVFRILSSTDDKLHFGSVGIVFQAPFASTDFDKGFFTWTIPLGLDQWSQFDIDNYILIVMDIVPAESGVYQAEPGLCDAFSAYCKIGPRFFRNPLTTLSAVFRIESDFSSFPEKFTYPAGGEKIPLGTPIAITWSPIPIGPNHFTISLEPSPLDSQATEKRFALKFQSLIADFEGDLTGKTGFTWDGKTLIHIINDQYSFLPGKWRFVLNDYLGHVLVGNDFELIPQ